jgi:malonyl CoA-acyl carrier protein transacylase
MPDKNEKERRRKIMNELQKKADVEFENSLPMSRENFKKLFDYLDVELTNKGCNHNNTITQNLFAQNSIVDSDKVIEWAADKGGYCDCEILANVKDIFD